LWGRTGASIQRSTRHPSRLGREAGVGAEHQLTGLCERERDLLGEHRCGPVEVGDSLDPEQLGLEPIPPLGDREAPAHRLDERHHRLVGGLVGEVARRQPVRIGAQAVVDRLVVHERVVDERAGPQPGFERGGHRLGNRAPGRAVGAHQPAERDVERQLLAADADAQGRHELAEQPGP